MEPVTTETARLTTPEEQAAALRQAAEAHERACLAEVEAVLARYGCRIIIAPAPVGTDPDLWTHRWGVRLVLND